MLLYVGQLRAVECFDSVGTPGCRALNVLNHRLDERSVALGLDLFIYLPVHLNLRGGRKVVFRYIPGAKGCVFSFSIYCQTLFRVLSAGVLCTLRVAG